MQIGRRCCGAALVCAWLTVAAAAAQDKKDAPPERPQILQAAPLAIASVGEVKLTIRGLKLDNASAVRVTGIEPPIEASVKSKGKANVPNKQDPKRIGDTQVEVAFTLPDGTAAGTASLVVTTPDGESGPYALRIEPADRLLDEKESNEGFAGAQEIEPGKIVRGTVQDPKDVDVYRFSATAGQVLVLDVHAARHGSALDPVLMLFDAEGRLLATADDAEDHRDALLRVTIPRDGAYFATLLDAHDEGSTAHPYLFSVQIAE